MHIIFVSELDGDQRVDFYWIDPVMVAERLAGKPKYAGKLYLQFKTEDSWTRPGVARLVVSMEGLYLRLPISWTEEVSQ